MTLAQIIDSLLRPLSFLGIELSLREVENEEDKLKKPKHYKGISIDDYTLFIPRSTTFAQLSEFIDSKPDNSQFMSEVYLYDLMDSSGNKMDLVNSFNDKLEGRSQETVYSFYHALGFKEDKDSINNLKIYYHTVFI